MRDLREDPAFLRYYAGVLRREADLRAPSEFSDWLRCCAARAMAEADAGPAQMELFAA